MPRNVLPSLIRRFPGRGTNRVFSDLSHLVEVTENTIKNEQNLIDVPVPQGQAQAVDLNDLPASERIEPKNPVP